MKYSELVEELNKDLRAIEQIDRPLTLYKSEQEVELARQEKVEKDLKSVKRFVYPFWTIAIVINSLLIIGYYQ